MAEAIRQVFGDVPIHTGDNGTRVSFNPLGRPGTGLIKDLQRDSSKAEAFLYGPATGEDARIVRCNLFQGRAENFLKARFYDKAHLEYLEAIAAIVGKEFKIPLPAEEGGVISAVYMNLTAWERIDLMACCNGIAQCMVGMKNIEEVDVLFLCYLDTADVNFLYIGLGMASGSRHARQKHVFLQ